MTRIQRSDISPVSAHPMVTPELVDHYVREGQRLRALTFRRLARQLNGAVSARLGLRRRMGRLTPTAAR